MKGKLVIFSAPSGAGKTTIVKHLLRTNPAIEFSISATSRAPRGEEINGVDYHFLSPEEFKKKINNQEFLEWEEVYPGTWYGTLKSDVEHIRETGKHVLFDVDVAGAIRIKKFYGDQALSIFIEPPSIEELQRRLVKRSTDSKESIEQRVQKATQELEFADKFDIILVNRDLKDSLTKAERIVREFCDK